MEPAMKVPFDIDNVMGRIQEAVRPFPKAALFELADEGYRTPFEQLLACMISIRTLDEVTLPTARRLFERARTPLAVSQLPVQTIAELIRPSTFYENKAPQIHAIACWVVADFGGIVPCEDDVLRSFPGVGPKCANHVLAIACGEPRISVDVHVHRVTNRWGYVHTRTPEQTMVALEAKLPPRYWVAINRLLVPFGKHICTARLPHCSTCPVLDMCQQVGVTAHG
jgi:endonuclease-3